MRASPFSFGSSIAWIAVALAVSAFFGFGNRGCLLERFGQRGYARCLEPHQADPVDVRHEGGESPGPCRQEALRATPQPGLRPANRDGGGCGSRRSAARRRQRREGLLSPAWFGLRLRG